jgi:hypothetical protein
MLPVIKMQHCERFHVSDTLSPGKHMALAPTKHKRTKRIKCQASALAWERSQANEASKTHVHAFCKPKAHNSAELLIGATGNASTSKCTRKESSKCTIQTYSQRHRTL